MFWQIAAVQGHCSLSGHIMCILSSYPILTPMHHHNLLHLIPIFCVTTITITTSTTMAKLSDIQGCHGKVYRTMPICFCCFFLFFYFEFFVLLFLLSLLFNHYFLKKIIVFYKNSLWEFQDASYCN